MFEDKGFLHVNRLDETQELRARNPSLLWLVEDEEDELRRKIRY